MQRAHARVFMLRGLALSFRRGETRARFANAFLARSAHEFIDAPLPGFCERCEPVALGTRARIVELENHIAA